MRYKIWLRLRDGPYENCATAWVNCWLNWKLYGCGYSKEVMDLLTSIENEIKKEEDEIKKQDKVVLDIQGLFLS